MRHQTFDRLLRFLIFFNPKSVSKTLVGKQDQLLRFALQIAMTGKINVF